MSDMRRYIEKRREGHPLFGLEPVPPARVAEIRAAYPWISTQYLDFISAVGVGGCPLMNIYEPVSLQTVSEHPSFMLYQGAAYRSAFGSSSVNREIPKDVVIIADVGASWSYCLSPDSGLGVLCFDMASCELLDEAETFFEFIDRDLFPDAG